MSQRDPAMAIPLPRERWRFAETERARVNAKAFEIRRAFRRVKTIKMEIGRRDHQAIGFRSLKKPPVGPFAHSVASQRIVSAPSSTERGAAEPPISVRTQPGEAQLTRTPVPRVAAASWRVKAFNAAFDIEYAGAYVPIDASCPASDETLTTRP